jgi:hypothetical protein
MTSKSCDDTSREWLGLNEAGYENWSGQGLLTSASCSYGVYSQGVRMHQELHVHYTPPVTNH